MFVSLGTWHMLFLRGCKWIWSIDKHGLHTQKIGRSDWKTSSSDAFRASQHAFTSCATHRNLSQHDAIEHPVWRWSSPAAASRRWHRSQWFHHQSPLKREQSEAWICQNRKGQVSLSHACEPKSRPFWYFLKRKRESNARAVNTTWDRHTYAWLVKAHSWLRHDSSHGLIMINLA